MTSLVTRLRTENSRIRGSIRGTGKDPFYYCIQTGYRVHSASYSMGVEGSFPGSKKDWT
jgi:hypothetical protein